MKTSLEILADTITNYSLEIKKDDKVLITYQSAKTNDLIKELIKAIYKNGGISFVKLVDLEINALLGEHTNQRRIEEMVKHSKFEVDHFDCFINLRYSLNDYEGKDVPKDILRMIGEKNKHNDDIRINKRRWVLLNYPSLLDAYKSKMKIDEYYDYAMDIMRVDYQKMSEDIIPLKKLMESTDKVRIVGPGTDLSFSIKGIPIIPCVGRFNIPDGEIFTAPIKNSVNGTITYNVDSPYQGHVFKDTSLTFKDGKIIKAVAGVDTTLLNQIIDTDEGSRYIGEFAIGLNPKIFHSMGDILYDEKIMGSIHFAVGRAYRESYNGNDSSIHWDMVLIQRKDYGGGEIYFDDELIRKDGIFVKDELKHLNYTLEKK